jgi:hypothetical protein
MTYRHSERTKNSVHVSIWDSRDHELHEPRKLIKNAYQRDKKIKSARGVVIGKKLWQYNQTQHNNENLTLRSKTWKAKHTQ